MSIKIKRWSVVFFSNYLLICMGLIGSISCFVDAFSIPVHMAEIIVSCLCAGLIALLIVSVNSNISRGFILSIVLVVSAIFLFMYWQELNRIFISMKYRIWNIWADELGQARPELPATIKMGWETFDCTRMFFVISAILSMILAWSIHKEHSFIIPFLSTFILLAAPIILTITPDWIPLMTVLAFWTILLVTHILNKHNQVNAAVMRLAFIPVISLVIAAIMMIVPAASYQRPTSINDFRDGLILWKGDINTQPVSIEYIESAAKDTGTIDLSQIGDLTFEGIIMIRVKDSDRNDHYLKAFSSAFYSGTEWKPLEEEQYQELTDEQWEDVLNTDQYMGVLSTSDIQLRYVNASQSYLYTPYMMAIDSETKDNYQFNHHENIRIINRTGVYNMRAYRLDDEQKYNGMITSGMIEQDNADINIFPHSFEQPLAYTQFVYEHYLQMPSELNEKLSPILPDVDELLAQQDELNIKPEDQIGTIDYTNEILKQQAVIKKWVRDYLAATASYTLSPGVTPKGADFVEYFLFQNKKGYCMHFATSAVMLLRAMGVPARYAQGYVVRGYNYDDSGLASVPDQQAHAWVEVYNPIYGWQSFEVTPGASLADQGEDSIFERDFPKPSQPILKSPSPPASPRPSPSPSPSPSPFLGQTPASSAEPTQSASGGQISNPGGKNPQDGKNQPPGWLAAIWQAGYTALAIGLAVGIYLLLRMWILKRRHQRFHQSNPNQSAIAIYLYIQRVIRFGGQMPANLVMMGHKAQFSQYRLDDQEMMEIRPYIKAVPREVYYKQSLWGKFLMRIQFIC